MQEKTLYITGMDCTACAELISNSIMTLQGVQSIKVDFKKKQAKLILSDDLKDLSAFLISVNELLMKNSYLASWEEFQRKEAIWHQKINKKEWLQALLFFILLWLFFRYIGTFLGFKKAEGISLPFSVGLASSLSSCLALTGSVIIAFTSLKQSSQHIGNKKNQWKDVFLTNTLLQLGRLLSFFFFGGILGMLGSQVHLSGKALFLAYCVIGFLLFFVALSILDIHFKFFEKLHLTGLTKYIKNLSTKKNILYSFLAGVLTFFLPCGFELSMMILAIQSSSFIEGAMTMMFFAIGTLPVLFFIGMVSSWSQHPQLGFVKKALGLLILFFAADAFHEAFLFYGAENLFNPI